MAISQWILGIRPTLEGLRVAPVVPRGWPGFRATRLYRGTAYDITVERAGEGNAVSLTVDGQPIAGDVVPLPAPGTERVQVQVVLR